MPNSWHRTWVLSPELARDELTPPEHVPKILVFLGLREFLRNKCAVVSALNLLEAVSKEIQEIIIRSHSNAIDGKLNCPHTFAYS